MSQWRSERIARRRVPDLCGTITAGGNNKPSVVAECGVEHRLGMESKLVFDLPGTKIPNAGDLVEARSDEVGTIRAEGGAENPVWMRQ